MSVFHELSFSPLFHRIGLTLLHSLWQLLLIAIVVVCILRIGKASKSFASASSRYLIQCCGLLLMLLVPFATFLIVEAPQFKADSISVQMTTATSSVPHHQLGFKSEIDPASQSPVALQMQSFDSAEPAVKLAKDDCPSNWLVAIAAIWFVGVTTMLLRSALQWNGARMLSRSNTLAAPHLRKTLNALIARLEIWQKVEVRFSRLVNVPTLVGWLKPVVLLPPAIISGLNARELELILLHELVHIKRYDFLVNVIQTVIESLLFYHPCVWWLSRQVRIEREFAADHFVVESSQDQATYVGALLHLEQLRGNSDGCPSPALGATDGALLTRVQRIVANVETDRAPPAKTNSFQAAGRGGIPVAVFAVTLSLAGCLLLVGPSYNKKTGNKKMSSNSNHFNESRESNPVSATNNPDDEFSYDGLDFGKPINQWQKAIETRNAEEVSRLLKEHPEFANTKIMDRYRDGRLNTQDHHQEALDHVARTGHVEIAKLLVEAGANDERIRGAFMIAEPNVAEFLMEHCDDPAPDVGLMAYIGKAKAMHWICSRALAIVAWCCCC